MNPGRIDRRLGGPSSTVRCTRDEGKVAVVESGFAHAIFELIQEHSRSEYQGVTVLPGKKGCLPVNRYGIKPEYSIR